MTLQFFVPGLAKPAGSKKAFAFKRRNGSIGASVVDDCAKSRDWKAMVADVGAKHFKGSQLLGGPLRVTFTFVVTRPQLHIRKNGSVKPDAPGYPTKRPDVLKLARAAEDALTGVVWADDSQIVTETIMKRYGLLPGVTIYIEDHP